MSEASRKALKSSLKRLAEEYEKTSKMVGGFADSAKARSDEAIKAYNAGIPPKIQEKLSIRDEISRSRKMNEDFQIPSAKLKSIEDGMSAESRQVDSLYAASRSSEKNKKMVDAGLSDTRNRIAELNSEGRSSWSQQKDATRGGQK